MKEKPTDFEYLIKTMSGNARNGYTPKKFYEDYNKKIAQMFENRIEFVENILDNEFPLSEIEIAICETRIAENKRYLDSLRSLE